MSRWLYDVGGEWTKQYQPIRTTEKYREILGNLGTEGSNGERDGGVSLALSCVSGAAGR